MIEKIKFKRVKKLWSFVKAGKGEINFVMSFIQIILLFSLKLETDFTWVQLIFFGGIFTLASFMIGILSLKEVNPVNQTINPYVQDFIQSNIDTYDAVLRVLEVAIKNEDNTFSKVKYDKAIEKIEHAKSLREKWMDE